MPVWLLPTIIATVGSIIVIVMTLREWRATGGGIGRSAAALHDIPCTLCRRSMHIQRADLKPLTGVEVGLVVQAIPEASGRKLAEVYCPHCQAIHTFAVDRRPPEWIGVNLSAPEQKAPVCLECRKPLRIPPWSPGEYDGKVTQAPDLRADYGLECPFCGCLSCVRCAEEATRNRTPDGSLRCPRCRRHPVDRFYHGKQPAH